MRALLILLIVGAASAGESAGIVRLPGTDLRIAIPPGWEIDRDRHGAALVLRGPSAPAPTGESPSEGARRDGARAAVAVTVTTLPAGEDAAAFADRCRNDLARLIPRADIDAAEAVPVLGRMWWRIRYRFPTAALAWEQDCYCTVVADRGICLTASCAEGVLRRWQRDIISILVSTGASRPELTR